MARKDVRGALNLFAVNGQYVFNGMKAIPSGKKVNPSELFGRFDIQRTATRSFAKPSDNERLNDIDFLENIAKRNLAGKISDKAAFNLISKKAQKYRLPPKFVQEAQFMAEQEKAQKQRPGNNGHVPNRRKPKAINILNYLFGGGR